MTRTQRRSTAILEADAVSVAFGGVQALDHVSLALDPGEVLGLIGPNGAGKTTLVDVLGGYRTPDSGRVYLDGVDVTGAAVHVRARRGLARGFQDGRLYGALSVDDVLRVSLDRLVLGHSDLAGMLLGLRSSRRAERFVATKANELIERFGLAAYRDATVNELSTGTRRVLELACVVAAEPRVAVLDEPTAGITHSEAQALAALIGRLRDDTGVSVIIVEHDVPLVLGLADRVVVLDAGRVLAEGPPAKITINTRVIDAYLGTSAGSPEGVV